MEYNTLVINYRVTFAGSFPFIKMDWYFALCERQKHKDPLNDVTTSYEILQIRKGIIFDPLLNLEESSHVTDMLAISLLIHWINAKFVDQKRKGKSLRHVITFSKFLTGSKIISPRTHQEKTGFWAQFEQFDFGCQRWSKSWPSCERKFKYHVFWWSLTW